MRVFWPLLLLLIPACTTVAPVSAPRGSVPLRHGPYLAMGSDTGMTVVWSTAVPGAGAVLFGPTPQLGSLVADNSTGTLHQVELTGLLPGTGYYYSVVSGGDSTPAATFRTAVRAGKQFTFAVYGDTRTRRAAHVEVLRRMAAYEPDFVLNTGDLVESNTEQNWDHFFTDLCESTTVGGSAPYYAVPGNHESGSMYYQNMVLPHDNPDSSEEYYSFTWGNLFVIAVDSEIPFGPSAAQYQWLKKELASPAARAAKFRIAFWHRPPYSTGRHGSDLEVRKVLAPLVEAAGVDIVFNGHDHDYERTVPFNGTTYIVAGGGGAPLYEFKADSTWDAYKEVMTHFCILRVSGDTLTVSTVRASDGSVRDSIKVVHPVPAGQPAEGTLMPGLDRDVAPRSLPQATREWHLLGSAVREILR